VEGTDEGGQHRPVSLEQFCIRRHRQALGSISSAPADARVSTVCHGLEVADLVL